LLLISFSWLTTKQSSNHNQELFSRIQEEQREISDYVDDKFVPEFLHAMIDAAD